MARKFLIALLAFLAIVLATACFKFRHEIFWLLQQAPIINRFFRPTVKSQIEHYGEAARARLQAIFAKRGMIYPPDKVGFIAIKDSNQFLVYAAAANSPFQYVCSYPILGASGHLGPKLRSGDRQVPEGIYQLSLEPNTPYHLALRLNYPNEFDLMHAREDGRTNPGSDILVHGTTGSVGCIAMGDEVSEDLFVLVYDCKKQNAQLIVTPYSMDEIDVKSKNIVEPVWVDELYAIIKKAMSNFPRAK
jgi:murein L,D-transpeptidase YafK